AVMRGGEFAVFNMRPPTHRSLSPPRWTPLSTISATLTWTAVPRRREIWLFQDPSNLFTRFLAGTNNPSFLYKHLPFDLAFIPAFTHSRLISQEVRMRKVTIVATIGVLALASALNAQQANPLQKAAEALGVAKIKTLQYTGSGANFSVGQNYTPNEPWPRVPVKSYTASINYDSASM